MRACEETDRPTEEEGVDIGVAFCLSDRLGGRRTEGGRAGEGEMYSDEQREDSLMGGAPRAGVRDRER